MVLNWGFIPCQMYIKKKAITKGINMIIISLHAIYRVASNFYLSVFFPNLTNQVIETKRNMLFVSK